MVLVRGVQPVTTADGVQLQTYIHWWAVTADRTLDQNSLNGSLPTELWLLTGLTSMCAHHAMG